MRNQDAAAKIANSEDFRNSTGSFYSVPGKSVCGRLPREWRDRYEDSRVVYTVYSYATPIAWLTESDGWVIPEVRYSNTTSRHQYIVRRAVDTSPVMV